MSSTRPPIDNPEAANRQPNAPNAVNSPPIFAAAPPQPAKPSTPAPPSWSSQPPAPTASQNGSAIPPSFTSTFSASTNEILERLRANAGNAAGSAAFEAKKAEVLQSYVTSDKMPTPPPIAGTGRRGGRGGGRATPSALKTDLSGVGATPASGATPTSARGSGRARGRGRGGGRGGKRKRGDSAESDDDSDISSSYTPVNTKTRSGRNVNKPVAFVPAMPEPPSGIKRRKSTKTILAGQCKICHRGTDPGNNRIVFCDVCNTPYHQYCHNPPIDNDVVTVLEKEWLCRPCERSKQNVIEGTGGLVAGDGLSLDQKRAYFSAIPPQTLVSLLLHATVRHPELPLFPPNIEDLISDDPSALLAKIPPTKPLPTIPAHAHHAPTHSRPSPPNGVNSTSGTPRSQHMGTDSSEIDPAEAQLLGEIRRSHQTLNQALHSTNSHTIPTSHAHPQTINPTSTSLSKPHHQLHTPAPAVDALHNMTVNAPLDAQLDELDDGYDTDPPAHYPKAGNGLARTMRPESEDLQWLVDDNFEVFSHGWKGDGSGVGADGEMEVGGGL
ncbi:hypothetical protein EJ04DRAFT_576458 [Polyplosphaeria fusca]|uniref:PHD-type domain-containing protein n=1 Tax=Polyplosphaeria fusca TaxID=682080 RepID=A0A9P4V473_9PLEO|nr:hypothetical protein EJ04DRAFT_576458 [Polyplosphaeria fusca]